MEVACGFVVEMQQANLLDDPIPIDNPPPQPTGAYNPFEDSSDEVDAPQPAPQPESNDLSAQSTGAQKR